MRSGGTGEEKLEKCYYYYVIIVTIIIILLRQLTINSYAWAGLQTDLSDNEQYIFSYRSYLDNEISYF